MQLPELSFYKNHPKFLSSHRFKTCPVLQFIFLGFQHDCQELYCLIMRVEPAAPIHKYMKQVILATYYSKTDKKIQELHEQEYTKC